MGNQEKPITPDAEKRICAEIEAAGARHHKSTLELGKLFFQLKNLYSERSNSAARRLSSGHGVFQKKIIELGFRPNRVREWVTDHEVRMGIRPPSESTASKRKARRQATRADTFLSAATDPVCRFAMLLPYTALKAAYRAALHEFHPDHGGSTEQTQELIAAWEAMFPHSDAKTAETETSTAVH
jgi:hypothetical protein